MSPTSPLDTRKGVACALIIAALLWLGLGRPFTADGPIAPVAVEPDPLGAGRSRRTLPIGTTCARTSLTCS